MINRIQFLLFGEESQAKDKSAIENVSSSLLSDRLIRAALEREELSKLTVQMSFSAESGEVKKIIEEATLFAEQSIKVSESQTMISMSKDEKRAIRHTIKLASVCRRRDNQVKNGHFLSKIGWKI